MRKNFFLIALFILFFSTKVIADDKITISVVIPLSGPVAEYGVAIKNGFELAQKKNSSLFDNLNFSYEDHRYDNTTTISIINQLASEKKISLVYLWGYGMCQAAVPIADTRKLAVMAVTAEEKINVGREYILRFSCRAEQLSQAILKYLRSKNYRKIGLIKTNIAYINSIIDGMKANLKSDESIEEIDSFQVLDADFRSTILKLKQKSFDVLGVLLVTNQVSEFFKQANTLAYKFNAFGASPFESVSEIKKANGLMQGAVFPGLDVQDNFRKEYLETYGNDIQLGWAANAYDFSLLAGSIANKFKGQKISRLEFLNEFKKISSFDGAEGHVFYKEDSSLGNGFEFPVVMKIVGKDDFSVVEESRKW